MQDFSYTEALEFRHSALNNQILALGQVVSDLKAVGEPDEAAQLELAARTEELRQLESDLATIWAMLQEAQGKSSKA